jgi:DNA-binding beta-propeller fold protein YncE
MDLLKFRHDSERYKPAPAQCFSFKPNARLSDIFRTSNNLGKLEIGQEGQGLVSVTDPTEKLTVVVNEKQTGRGTNKPVAQKELYSVNQVLKTNEVNSDFGTVMRDTGSTEKENSKYDADTNLETNSVEFEDNGGPNLQINANGKLNVKLFSDKEDCDISGIDMISDNELVLADYNNRSIKVLDMIKNEITHEMKLEYHPYDLTVPCTNTVAVTLTNTIQIITKSHLLRLGDSITVDGECYGITSSRTKYFVSFIKPVPKVAILNHQGDVLQTFSSDHSKRLAIKRPRYLDISPDEKYIYVTDFGKDCIIQLSASGELINTFSDASILNGPYGLHVDERGCVLVCNYGNDNIYEFSADLSKHRIVLSKSDGVESPQVIFMCNKEEKLYIASTDSADCNEIQVFSHYECSKL